MASNGSANSHHGTLINDPTWTVGHSGSALAFDGLDDHVEVAHATALNAYPLTVAAWIKTGSTTGIRGIVNKYVPYSLGAYGGAEYFPGVLDEVWIYDRALNPDEIASLASPATLSSTAP